MGKVELLRKQLVVVRMQQKPPQLNWLPREN
jgi:hypothetical protein